MTYKLVIHHIKNEVMTLIKIFFKLFEVLFATISMIYHILTLNTKIRCLLYLIKTKFTVLHYNKKVDIILSVDDAFLE